MIQKGVMVADEVTKRKGVKKNLFIRKKVFNQPSFYPMIIPTRNVTSFNAPKYMILHNFLAGNQIFVTGGVRRFNLPRSSIKLFISDCKRGITGSNVPSSFHGEDFHGGFKVRNTQTILVDESEKMVPFDPGSFVDIISVAPKESQQKFGNMGENLLRWRKHRDSVYGNSREDMFDRQ